MFHLRVLRFCCLIGGFAHVSFASSQTFILSGVVTAVVNTNGIAVGNPVFGTLTYDSSQAASPTSIPNIATYGFSLPPNGLSVTINGFTFAVDVSGGMLAVVYHNYIMLTGPPPGHNEYVDAVAFAGLGSVVVGPPVFTGQYQLNLGQQKNSLTSPVGLLSSLSLPTSLVPSAAPITGMVADAANTNYQIHFTINTITSQGSNDGTISVSTNLSAATFTISGPTTYHGSGTSFMQTGAPIGKYTISYGAVGGYTAPASEQQSLTTGGIISFTRTYAVGLPSLTVDSPSLSFSYQEGSGGARPQLITVTGSAPVAFFTGIAQTPGSQWLFPTIPRNPTPQTVTVSVSPSLPAGNYQTVLSFSPSIRAPGVDVPVSLTVTSAVPPPPVHTLVFATVATRSNNPWPLSADKLWTAFRESSGDSQWPDGFLQTERENLDSGGYTDACYAGTIDTLWHIVSKQMLAERFSVLGQQIISLPLSFFPAESILGKILLQTGEFLISAATSDNLSQAAVEFAADQALGYVLPLAVGEYGSDLISAGLSTQDYAAKLFSDEGATVASASGNNQGSQYGSQTFPLTTTIATLAYNPYTHYAIVGARSDCGDGTVRNYLFIFQLAPPQWFGLPSLVPNTMQKLTVPN